MCRRSPLERGGAQRRGVSRHSVHHEGSDPTPRIQRPVRPYNVSPTDTLKLRPSDGQTPGPG